MIDIFRGLKTLIKVSHVHIDSTIFRLHYTFTVMCLLAFSLIVTTRQYVGNPIDCVHTKVSLFLKGCVHQSIYKYIFIWIDFDTCHNTYFIVGYTRRCFEYILLDPFNLYNSQCILEEDRYWRSTPGYRQNHRPGREKIC